MWKAPKKLLHLAQNWQWGLEMDEFDLSLFSKGQAPTITNEEATFASAGSLYDMNVAARMTFDPITFEKGVLADGADDAALRWLFATANVNTQSGWVPDDYKRTVDVVQLARTGQVFRRWRCYQAWIKSLKYTDLDGSSNDITIESLELRYFFAEPIDPEAQSTTPIYGATPREVSIVSRREVLNTSAIVTPNY